MSENCRKALPKVHEGSGGPPGCLGVVGRPSRMFGVSREDFLDVLEW